MIVIQWCQKLAKQPAFEPVSYIANMFLYLLTDVLISVTFLYWQETNQITNFQARFFYNVVLYYLTELPIAIVDLYWQVFFFLEYFPQMNMFASICAVCALLIIGCTI